MTVVANDVRTTAIPWLVSSTGVLISIGFMVAAGVMNWRYGLGLGRSEQDQGQRRTAPWYRMDPAR